MNKVKKRRTPGEVCKIFEITEKELYPVITKLFPNFNERSRHFTENEFSQIKTALNKKANKKSRKKKAEDINKPLGDESA